MAGVVLLSRSCMNVYGTSGSEYYIDDSGCRMSDVAFCTAPPIGGLCCLVSDSHAVEPCINSVCYICCRSLVLSFHVVLPSGYGNGKRGTITVFGSRKKVITNNGDQAARRPHILCSICVYSFVALAKHVRLFMTLFRCHRMCSFWNVLPWHFRRFGWDSQRDIFASPNRSEC